MCTPLCFDPEDAQQQLEWGGVSENALENMVPLAQFYEEKVSRLSMIFGRLLSQR